MKIEQFDGPKDYLSILEKMRTFTQARNENTQDHIWLLEHSPVFTQGQAGKSEHVLQPGNIPVIQSDRGGQVTYHGPGQLMIYTLCDLKRLNHNVKTFVQTLQHIIIQLLKQYEITAHLQCGAPGVYVNEAKICSIGLRVRRGYTYHGLSLNVNMDLSPFTRINPCGFKHLKMTQIREHLGHITTTKVAKDIQPLLNKHLNPLVPHLVECVEK